MINAKEAHKLSKENKLKLKEKRIFNAIDNEIEKGQNEVILEYHIDDHNLIELKSMFYEVDRYKEVCYGRYGGARTERFTKISW